MLDTKFTIYITFVFVDVENKHTQKNEIKNKRKSLSMKFHSYAAEYNTTIKLKKYIIWKTVDNSFSRIILFL